MLGVFPSAIAGCHLHQPLLQRDIFCNRNNRRLKRGGGAGCYYLLDAWSLGTPIRGRGTALPRRTGSLFGNCAGGKEETTWWVRNDGCESDGSRDGAGHSGRDGEGETYDAGVAVWVCPGRMIGKAPYQWKTNI